MRQFILTKTNVLPDDLCVHSTKVVSLLLWHSVRNRFIQFVVSLASFAVCIYAIIDGSQSKRSYVALGVLILNEYMLLDILNSGRVCRLAPMLC